MLKNGVSGHKQKNRSFERAHNRYLLYQIFLHGGRQTQRYFNVSSPSSRRNNKFCFNQTIKIFILFLFHFLIQFPFYMSKAGERPALFSSFTVHIYIWHTGILQLWTQVLDTRL